MKPTARLSTATTVLLSFFVCPAWLGCAGDGSELGEQVPLEPTLLSIQQNIFTPICAVPGCHSGARAPQGLALDSASQAFDGLVGLASAERPELLLVDPAEPEESYLVWKIEGRDGIVGQPMPRDGPPLSGEQIETIRRWISDGAPPP